MADPLAPLETAAREREAALPKAQREARGVVHTPSALARWIVSACPAIEGETTLIDPACGPGVFLAAAIAGLRGRPTRVLGLDVDPAAIALARRELAPLYRSAGWPLELAVGDALDAVPTVTGTAIVVGNPPWTARSASRGVTDALLDDFRVTEAGEQLGERKIGVLSDAYVRFVRWALAVVERASRGGTIAMVVSSSFLDGRVHRGMRSYLVRALDRLAIVDLGGSALVARRAGVRDDNLFGVRPGAAIVVGTREPGDRARSAAMRVTRVRGSASEKLDALGALDAGAIPPVAIGGPLFRFAGAAGRALPSAWPTIDAWMPWSREGVQTNRDALCVDADRDALLAKVRAFAERPDRALARPHFDPVAAARRLREETVPLDRFVTRIAYRPMDARWLFTHPAVCHRARPEIAAALAHAPLALVTASKDRGERPWAHLGIVTTIADNCWLSSRSSCRARLWPVCAPDGSENVGPEVRAAIERIAGPVTARDVIAFVAAVLASARYREAFDEALRAGPIRVPIPPDAGTFRAIVRAGDGIVAAFSPSPSPSPSPSLVVGHRTLSGESAEAIGRAQREADTVVRDLIVSAP